MGQERAKEVSARVRNSSSRRWRASRPRGAISRHGECVEASSMHRILRRSAARDARFLLLLFRITRRSAVKRESRWPPSLLGEEIAAGSEEEGLAPVDGITRLKAFAQCAKTSTTLGVGAKLPALLCAVRTGQVLLLAANVRVPAFPFIGRVTRKHVAPVTRQTAPISQAADRRRARRC